MSMSTNITSTSNGARQNGSKSSAPIPASGENFPRYPFAAIPLPDPAVIERLANEFFLAMPKDLGDGGSSPAPPAAESDEIPVFSFPEMPRAGPPPSIAASPPPSPPGPLTETDLRAIAASLAGAMALAPGIAGTAPSSPVPNSPPGFPAGGNISPISVAPTLPPGAELFSFPGTLGVPWSPLAPPGGADTVAAQPPGAPTASPEAIPPAVHELFSFPRVPAMPGVPGIETIPRATAPFASPSAAPPTHDVKGIAPEAPRVPPTAASGSSAPGTPAPLSSLPVAKE